MGSGAVAKHVGNLGLVSLTHPLISLSASEMDPRDDTYAKPSTYRRSEDIGYRNAQGQSRTINGRRRYGVVSLRSTDLKQRILS